MCAAMLSYKIVILQARIEGSLDWIEPSTQHLTQKYVFKALLLERC